MYIKIFIFFLLLSFCQLFAGQEEKDFGHIEFPSSVNPKYNELFIKGVLLLHNFQYDDAQKTFIELQKKDPSFALAYWGEAMTYNHPIWNEQEIEKGQKALNKFSKDPKERVAKAKTPVEKGLMDSINILYGPGDKKHRDYLYALALRDLYQQHPNDNEVALFYALALLGKEQGVQNTRQYMQAASIANDVLIRNPRHPGAMHYFIHSVDDPLHAPLGLNAARAYSVIAPAAAHAAHMPSHIFLALGLWDEVIESNRRAWSEHDTIDVHALQWLHYGYLQAGEFDKANEYLNLTYEMAKASSNPLIKWHYTQMRAAQIVSAKKYDRLSPSVSVSDISLSAIASDYFANALISLFRDKKDITPQIEELQKIYLSKKKQFESHQGIGKDNYSGISEEGLASAQIVLLQLMALNHWANGEKKQAYEKIKEAVSVQARAALSNGPPIPPKPSKEILAEFLFEDQQFGESCRVIQELLLVFPNRREALEILNKIEPKFKCTQQENIFFHRLL